ncbi:Putative DNA-binding domain-containing protein [Candidatus Thermokryptus mobilis]|uniref:Putative DNA-binding domain-containing protein n=1 Tax=Candidatus Thermokryptus mobilis TaxID=1643428 RepID=A0A0S4MTX5_9BACT|nr:ATP-binding protein [Candidatus Thermokryptus mobilis]CUU02372.1 Putative DNA-binding domain-containing protein [Candidatus Thermokryptus mobilis]
MNLEQLNNLIFEGEGLTVEFKRKVSSPEKIARAMIAFANTHGGVLIFGIDDDGSVVGVDSEKEEVDLIFQAARQHCYPPIEPKIEIFELNGKDVIVATIEQSQDKPHRLVSSNGDAGKVFIRLGSQNVVASEEMIKLMKLENDNQPLRIMIGEKERRLLNYLDNFKKITVKEFSKLVKISEDEASDILVNLVRVGILKINITGGGDYFTLV